MSTNSVSLDLDSLTPVHWLAIAAALVTAGVHLVLGIAIGGVFGISFLAATAGFLAGIAAVLVGWRRRLVYLLGIPYTGGQIVLWYLLNDVPPVPTSHAVDKIAQLVLITALVVLYYRGDSFITPVS